MKRVHRAHLARLHDRDLQLLSYSSLQHSANKPDVDAFLRGEESEPPYTEVAWREEVVYLRQASEEDAQEWLSVARILSHEKLRDHSNTVVDLIQSSGRQHEVLVRDSDGEIAPFAQVEDFRNALLILPPGILGLSSGMLAEDNDGSPFDVTDNKWGLRFVKQDDRVLGLGSTDESFTEDDFGEFLRRNKMLVRLAIALGGDAELIYVEKKPPRAKATGDVYLDEHLAAVERNVRALAEKPTFLRKRFSCSHDVQRCTTWARHIRTGSKPLATAAGGTSQSWQRENE